MQLKKIIAIFLAAALIFSVIATTAIAENNEILKVGVEVITSAPLFSSHQLISCGDEITVRVSINQNTGVSYLRSKLDFNPDYFELVDVSSNKLFGSSETIKTFSDYIEYYINYSNKNVINTGTLFDAKFKVKENICGDALFSFDLSQNSNPRNCCSINLATGVLTVVPFIGDSADTVVHFIDSENPTVQKPSCTEDGFTAYNCKNEGCDYSLEVDRIEKFGHSIDRFVIDPTCLEGGYTIKICSNPNCDYYEIVDEVPAKGHNYDPVVTEPTCTSGGFTTYTCSGCGDTYDDDATEPLGHSYDEVVTAPTCTEDGYTTYTCSRCNDEYTDNVTENLGGHKLDSVVTEPTCTEGGFTTHTCSVCGYSYNDTETEALGHSYNSVVTEPTCTEGGFTTHTCSVCGDTYTDAQTEVIGHSYNSVVTEPTCTDGGFTTHTCSVCGDVYTDAKTDALGHTEGTAVEENKVDATCTENGSFDLVKYCTVCHAEIERINNVIEATGHVNGEKVQENIVLPTCTENGSHDDVIYCTVCNAEVSRESVTDDALGHKNADAVQENRVESTCTVAGSYDNVVYCSVCNDELSREKQTLALKEHAYVTNDAKAPTCTEVGWDAYRTCEDCDYTELSEKPALGHTWGEATTILPEYKVQGYSEHTCTVCNTTEKFDYTDALTYILGDVDANEVVDSDDAVYLLYYTFYSEEFPINQLGDFDGNGTVDSDDAVYLLYYTFYPEEFPLFDTILDVEMGGDEV